MSIVYLPVEIANPKTPNKKIQIECLVDSGSHFSIVPKEILKKLSLIPHTKRSFLLANGEKMEREVGDALFFYEGSRAASPVIFGEREDATIVGVVTLESLGLVFNPIQRKLYPAKMMFAKVGEGEPQPLDNFPKKEQDSAQETAPEAGLEEAKPSESGGELSAEEQEKGRKIKEMIEKETEMTKGSFTRWLKSSAMIGMTLLALGQDVVRPGEVGAHDYRSTRGTARDKFYPPWVQGIDSLRSTGAAAIGALVGAGAQERAFRHQEEMYGLQLKNQGELLRLQNENLKLQLEIEKLKRGRK